MKKMLTLFIILLCIPFLSLEATPPMEIGVKLKIDSKDCNNGYFNNGHFDLLVLKEEVGERLLSTINENYIDRYGDIETIAYLTAYQEIWVSYQAYVSEAYTDYLGSCNVTLMSMEDMMVFTSIKLVYFSNEGTTFYVSSPIATRDLNEQEEYVDLNLDFDADEPYHLDITYENEDNNYTFIFLLIAGIYLLKYGGILFLSVAGILIVYAIIRVIIVQMRRRNEP